MFQIYLIRSEETRRLGALEVGDYSTSDTNDVIRVCTEVVVPRSRSRPHLVVLQQVGVYENTQLSAVTKGRHAIVGLSNPLRVQCIERVVVPTQPVAPSLTDEWSLDFVGSLELDVVVPSAAVNRCEIVHHD